MFYVVTIAITSLWSFGYDKCQILPVWALFSVGTVSVFQQADENIYLDSYTILNVLYYIECVQL